MRRPRYLYRYLPLPLAFSRGNAFGAQCPLFMRGLSYRYLCYLIFRNTPPARRGGCGVCVTAPRGGIGNLEVTEVTRGFVTPCVAYLSYLITKKRYLYEVTRGNKSGSRGNATGNAILPLPIIPEETSW